MRARPLFLVDTFLRKELLIVLFFFAAILVGSEIGSAGRITLTASVVVVIVVFVAVLILMYPPIGLGSIIASEIFLELLPDIPGIVSLTVVLGGITLGAYLLNRLFIHTEPSTETRVSKMPALIAGLAFVVWAFISNPQAAFGVTSDRNYVQTFAQLVILFWLTNQLLVTRRAHETVILIIILASALSAVSALWTVYTDPSGAVYKRVGESGLSSSPALAARYFVVAIFLLYYFFERHQRLAVRGLSAALIVLLLLGVSVSLNRAAIVLLLAGVLGTLFLRRSVTNNVLIALAGMLLLVLFIPDTTIATFERRFSQTSPETGEYRSVLWSSGLKMFRNSPLTGVGIGRYRFEIASYAGSSLPERTEQTVAHNTYIEVAATTGVIGITLFMAMLALTMRQYLEALRTTSGVEWQFASLWFVITALMLLNGLFVSDQYSKLLWFTLGVGYSFAARPEQFDDAPNRPLAVPGRAAP